LLREIRQEKERNKLKLIAWMQDFQNNKNKTKTFSTKISLILRYKRSHFEGNPCKRLQGILLKNLIDI
jgi:hypothetical protein